jgi:hypothetical protein
MELPRQYSYNPKWWLILALALFFGACGALAVNKATHNSVGLIINGIIELGPAGATAFYWVMAALAGLFVLMAILLALRRIANPQTLELGTEALRLPHGFLQTKTALIPYAEIDGVSETEVNGQTLLHVAANGRRLTVAASLFQDTDSYLAVRDFLFSQAPR